MRERSQRFDPRQIMQSDTFEVFHYREPRANTVEVHHHDFYEIYYLISGNVEYWIDGRIIRMEPGDLLLINPMELHRPMLEQGTLYERFVLWINKAFLENISSKEPLNQCFDTSRPNRTNLIRPSQAERTMLMTRLAEMVRESYSQDFGGSISAYGQFLQFMVQLNRLAGRTDYQEESQQRSPLVQRVLQYVSEHFSEPICLEQLAAEFYISKYHLAHAFSREVGVSIYRYIMLRRLLLARQLLAGGESAKQVCRSCGFSDYTSFYRAFKSEYGISPGKIAGGG